MRRKLKFDKKRFSYLIGYRKTMRVIDSCKTYKQLESAAIYGLLWFAKYNNEHDVNCLINLRELLINKQKMLYGK